MSRFASRARRHSEPGLQVTVQGDAQEQGLVIASRLDANARGLEAKVQAVARIVGDVALLIRRTIPLSISPAISAEQGLTGRAADCFNGHQPLFIKELRLPMASVGGDVGNGMASSAPLGSDSDPSAAN